MKKTVRRNEFKKVVEQDDASSSDQYGEYVGDYGGRHGYVWNRETGALLDTNGKAVHKASFSVSVGRNQFEYFSPAHQPKKATGKPSKSDIEYMLYNWKDAEKINSGEVTVLFIRAEVEVVVAGTIQTISSGGLGGVDVSDTNDPYIDEIFEEESRQLEDVLKEMGFRVS